MAEGSLGVPLDRKYRIVAECREHGGEHLHDEHDAVLFLAHDMALPFALQAYRQESVRLAASKEQIKLIDELIEGVRLWQARYPVRVKVADVGDRGALGPAPGREPRKEPPPPPEPEPGDMGGGLGRLG